MTTEDITTNILRIGQSKGELDLVSKTIIEWHSVDELPKESGRYIIKLYNGDLMSINYSSKYKKFNALDTFSEKEAKRFNIKNDEFVAWGTTFDEE